MKRMQTKEAEAAPQVGYGRPPRQHRWKKGQSGNPRGRRKGKHLLTVFKQVVMKKVTVPVAGEPRRMTIAEYVLRTNYDAALRRNQKAMANMLLVAEVAGHLVNAEDLKRIGVPIAQSQALATDEFEAMFGSAVPNNNKRAGTPGPK